MEKCSQGSERLFDIIEIIAVTNDMGVTEVAKKAGLAKSTTHRILSSLVSRNYLEKNLQTDKYRLGYKFIAVAGNYMSQLDLRTASAPYTHQLSGELGATVHIAVLRDNVAVYIEKVQPFSYISMYSEIGKSIGLYCSSLGKALLLGFTEDAFGNYIDNLAENPGKAFLAIRLEKEIEEAKKTQFTYDNEENEAGVYCMGTPIYDYKGQVLAAISISGRNKEIITGDKYKVALKRSAKEISKLFGGKII